MTYGKLMKMRGINFDAITVDELIELNRCKGIVPIIKNGSVVDLVLENEISTACCLEN